MLEEEKKQLEEMYLLVMEYGRVLMLEKHGPFQDLKTQDIFPEFL